MIIIIIIKNHHHNNNNDQHNDNLKAKASCRRPQNIEKGKNIKMSKMNIVKKLIILKGFRQNGHHHRIQRISLRIVALVKIVFRHFFRT